MRRWKFILLSFICGYIASYAIHASLLKDHFDPLKSLFTPDKKWIWCPLEVTKIMIVKTSNEISEPASVAELCKASMSKTLPISTKGNFRAILRAQNIKGEVTFLEYDSSQHLFRIESHVFSSTKYEAQLTKYLELY